MSDKQMRIWLAKESMPDGTDVLHLGLRLPEYRDNKQVECISFGHHVAQSLEERAVKLADLVGLVIVSSGNAASPYLIENGDSGVWKYQLSPVVPRVVEVFEGALMRKLMGISVNSRNGTHKH